MPTTKEMSTLTIDGVTYEVVDKVARESGGSGSSVDIQVLEWTKSDFTFATQLFNTVFSDVWGKTYIINTPSSESSFTVLNISLYCLSSTYTWGSNIHAITLSPSILAYVSDCTGMSNICYSGSTNSGSPVFRAQFDSSTSGDIVIIPNGNINVSGTQYIQGQIVII